VRVEIPALAPVAPAAVLTLACFMRARSTGPWSRCAQCCSFVACSDFGGITLDFSRQRATPATLSKLLGLAEVRRGHQHIPTPSSSSWAQRAACARSRHSSESRMHDTRASPLSLDWPLCLQAAGLKEKIASMFAGEHVSTIPSPALPCVEPMRSDRCARHPGIGAAWSMGLVPCCCLWAADQCDGGQGCHARGPACAP